MCCTFAVRRKSDGAKVTVLLEDMGMIEKDGREYYRSVIVIYGDKFISDTSVKTVGLDVAKRMQGDDYLLRSLGYEQIKDHQTENVPCPLEL